MCYDAITCAHKYACRELNSFSNLHYIQCTYIHTYMKEFQQRTLKRHNDTHSKVCKYVC